MNKNPGIVSMGDDIKDAMIGDRQRWLLYGRGCCLYEEENPDLEYAILKRAAIYGLMP